MLRVEPNADELELIKEIELEKYEKTQPEVHLLKRTRETHNNLDVDVGDSLGAPIVLNADFDLESSLKELQDGYWVKTQKIKVRFCKPQLEAKGVDIEKGDIIDLFPDKTQRYEVLQTGGSTSKVKMSDYELHKTATINLEHTWASS